ncbi:tetratricopeptide repeat protein [Vibrio sp. 16]|uniref:TPR domain-containing protein n=1 Tax=Vibrio sp. 16 TaxID=391586 RepID=UPI002FF0C17D
MKKIVLFSAVIAVPLFMWFKGSPPLPPDASEQVTRQRDPMSDIQGKLKQDPNQAPLWFQLGHGYLNQQEFDAALTSFDYAIRLSPEPVASHYAAKATARYYLNNQVLDDEVSALLNKAIKIEPLNLTALALIASDHFISFRYQQAIDTWTKMLDSQDRDLDRASIIHSLNLAKQMQNNQ